jgi:5-methyltetrahydrofolate--homocysteine methyltransferase
VTFDKLRHRLRAGRPLVLDADTCASFRARGVHVDSPGAVGVLLRDSPDDVLEHYRAEVMRRVDVLSALTADTAPRALAEVGMPYRAAVLTGRAIELALEAASEGPKPVAVAGVLGSEMVGPVAADRFQRELNEHAQRLAVAGCELIIARGQGSRLELMSAVLVAVETALPTWAVVECTGDGEPITGGSVPELLTELEEAGASVVLFEVPSIDQGVEQLRRAKSVGSVQAAPGVLLAGGEDSVRGFPDSGSVPDQWARNALNLDAAGARVIGGGAGTTEAHTAALAQELGALHPSLPT